ncbi:MAG: hypothetical protein IJY20_05420 [Clostridia bacterium]|nr:hypothetical protein [Clostridia bacterium]
MKRKNLGKACLFLPLALLILLTPVSVVLLVCAMVYAGSGSVLAILSYILSAYVLTVWCIRIPYLIRFFRAFRHENKYARRWFADEALRMKVSLYGSLALNIAYAVFWLWLGLYHRSFWFYSLAAYYASLALMRFFLVRHARQYAPGERLRAELVRYRACGVVFLVMNLALALMVFFMVYWNRSFHHHEITAIAMAAYTFTAVSVAIIHLRRQSSPLYSAARTISLAAACVSLLTLESTMLTAFGDGSMAPEARRLLLGISGGVISALILAMAIYMILQSTKQLQSMQIKETTDGKEE